MVGYGDILMLSAVAREVQLNNPNVKKVRFMRPIVKKNKFVKKNGKINYRDLSKHDGFKNNPRIYRPGDSLKDTMTINFSHGPDPPGGGRTYHYFHPSPENSNHWNFTDPETHVITQFCKFFDICDQPSELKCEIYFTEQEKDKVKQVMLEHGLREGKFVVIEPHTKMLCRRIPITKFQALVDYFSDDKFVQVGFSGADVLNNVLNLTGKLNFREIVYLIQLSKSIISPEGGLMHASNAVNKEGIFIYSGLMNPKTTCYPNNINIWIGNVAIHGACFNKECVICPKLAEEYPVKNLITQAERLLGGLGCYN